MYRASPSTMPQTTDHRSGHVLADGTTVRHIRTNSIKSRVPFPLCRRSPGTETSRTTNKITAIYTRTCILMAGMLVWECGQLFATARLLNSTVTDAGNVILHYTTSVLPPPFQSTVFISLFSASATKSYKTRRQTALPRLTVKSKSVAAL